MGKRTDSGRPAGRRIDAEARACFLGALRGGARRDEAARRAGYSAQAFYNARRRDPVFRLAWIWALALTAAEERDKYRASTLAAGAAGVEIAPNNQRRLQARRVRSVRFGAARKKIFCDRFAGTADVFASAEAAGVHWSTAYRHRAADPQFAQDWDEALRQSYALLEAEAVRQRLEAQRRLRESPEPTGEMAREFERVLQLLQRMDRRDGRIGTRAVRHGRQKRWRFDDAIALLDKKLRALGARHGVVPPEDGPGLLPRPEPDEGPPPEEKEK